MIRQAGLVIAGVAAAVLAVRVAAVDAFAERRPELAAKVWPSHPRVVTARGMTSIGAAAAAGKPPPALVTSELTSLVQRDPMNATALLVAGTEASARGDAGRAERLLLAASRRDPFAPAPRYLLTDLYLRQGRGGEGLEQLAYLLRRVGPNAGSLLPALVQFAATPGGAGQLRTLLRTQPDLRERLLDLLAADPANLGAILALAGPHRPGPAPQWQATLLGAMIARQDYAGARRAWTQLSGAGGAGQTDLFNPRFVPGGPSPPFNWRLGGGSAGVAEAQPAGGLHVLYYGRENMVLAEQMLLLPLGRYRLQQELAGSPANLSWALVCLPGGAAQEGAADRAFGFRVDQTCRAQRLELRGNLADGAATTDVTIRQVRLVREGGE